MKTTTKYIAITVAIVFSILILFTNSHPNYGLSIFSEDGEANPSLGERESSLDIEVEAVETGVLIRNNGKNSIKGNEISIQDHLGESIDANIAAVPAGGEITVEASPGRKTVKLGEMQRIVVVPGDEEKDRFNYNLTTNKSGITIQNRGPKTLSEIVLINEGDRTYINRTIAPGEEATIKRSSGLYTLHIHERREEIVVPGKKE